MEDAVVDESSPHLSNHVIVCGLGHVGHRICELLSRMGYEGVVIAREVHDEHRLAEQSHFTVLKGDARDESLLVRTGIRRARAILAVTNDDLTNLSIALDARRLQPGITVVVRMFDRQLALHLEPSIRPGRILSASALAAPIFAARAMGDSVRAALAIDDTTCVVETMPTVSADRGHAREHVQHWAGETGCCLLGIERGDRFIPGPLEPMHVMDSDRPVRLRLTGPSRQSRAEPLSLHSVRGMLAMWLQQVPAPVRIALGALLLLMAGGVAYFHADLGLPWVDSLYFVVTTITTVGYGDYNLMNASAATKVFGVLLMLSGAGIMASLFGLLTSLIVELRFRDLLTARCAHFRGHTIVVGLGNLGFRLLKQLRQSGARVVAIESREDAPLFRSSRDLAPVVIGDARADETLARAGIDGAAAIITATGDDLTNLSVALSARRKTPQARVTLRIFDARLAGKMQVALDIESVLSVSHAAAPTFVGSILAEDVVQGILLGDWLLLIFHRPRDATSRSTGRSGERILFYRRKGASTFQTVEEPGEIADADAEEVIGVVWFALKTGTGTETGRSA